MPRNVFFLPTICTLCLGCVACNPCEQQCSCSDQPPNATEQSTSPSPIPPQDKAPQPDKTEVDSDLKNALYQIKIDWPSFFIHHSINDAIDKVNSPEPPKNAHPPKQKLRKEDGHDIINGRNIDVNTDLPF